MEKYLPVLKQNPLFKGLTENELLLFLNNTAVGVNRRREGEYILRAGDTVSSMGVVLSGSVLVIQEDIWGRRNIMARVSAGDIFAEVFAAAQGTALNVSVVADTDCEIMLLSVRRLLAADHAVGDGEGKVVRNLVSLLARKAMTFNEKITHLSKRTTREKLLSFLSAQATRQGKLIFDIAYDRQQLADYLCVDRAAMSVELSKLQKEGVLSYHKNHFELKELAEL